MESMRIEIWQTEETPNTTVLHVKNELDSSSVEKLNEVFAEVLEKYPRYVIADMSEVTLFSSAALGRFMGFKKRLVESKGDLVLAGLTLEIKSQLTSLGAFKIFRSFANVSAAVNAYKWEREGISQALTLSFPPELHFVPPVRQLVSRIAKQKGYSSRDSFRIETIVDEVCNNAVEHGDGEQRRDVDLFLGIDREKVEIKVVNTSNPSKVEVLKQLSKSISKTAMPDLQDKRGRGLALIKMLSNNLSIDFSENGTSVHVTRFRGD
ncbi:MAG: STAS domain-containing protein [Chitinivibrionales bacterium]|nr:STAS domain-containing protein [Chitinivibrionales bacterium]